MAWNRQPISTLITAATHEPVDLTEAKTFLRVDHPTEDAFIEAMITSARVWVETYTQRTLCHQTWEFQYRDFPQLRLPLFIPHAPASSVTSITYLDGDNASQTWASTNYALRTLAGPTAGRGWIEVSDAVDYPTLSSEAEYPVTVRATCGYGANASSVPAGIKAAVYLLLGDLYSSRQETIVGAVSSKAQTTIEKLLGPYRLPEAA